MTKPKHFNLNSDYATTQNDASGTLSYTVTNGTVIPDLTTTTFEAYLVLGTRNAYQRAQASTTAAPGQWFSGTTLITEINVDLAGFGITPWPLYHSLERTSPSSVRAYCEIYNNTGLTMTVAANQTLTWEVNTFLSPFPS